MAEQWIKPAAREVLVDAMGEATQEEIDAAAAIIQRHYEAAKCPECDGQGVIAMKYGTRTCHQCGGEGRIVT